jgi:hypothetical protein
VSTGRNAWAYVDSAGRRIPSVTECLRLAGLVDLDGIPVATLETARQRGKDVHAWIESSVLGLLDDVTPDPRIAGYVEAWEKFRVATGFASTDTELRVVHATYGYAGTIDLLGTIGGDAWLLDVKATAQVPPEAALQTAGYRMALGEPRRRGVIHVRRDGGWSLVEHRNHREDEADFLAALRIAVWRLRHHGGARLEG